jgi:hypothetical protein
MRHQGVPVTRAKLDYLRSFIKTLCKKMESDPAKPKYILTEPWVGHRFCNPLAPETAAPRKASN